MGKSVFLATVLTLLGGVAFAGHAISLEPEVPEAAPASTVPAATTQESTASSPAAAPAAQPAPAPEVNVAFPSELDLYVVPAATREVCTTRDWGFGEVQTDCRMKPVPVRREDPALSGLCITRYGHRICY